MDIKIIPNLLLGSVPAISSKSHAHRLFIAASLSQSKTKVNLGTTSEDINATKACLRALNKQVPVLDCGESGSTLRFLLPLAMALKKKAIFLGSERLAERPMAPLKEAMEANGCSFSNSNKTINNRKELFTVEGKLQSGTFTLPGNVSSQFITGLLFALPLLKGDSTIEVTEPMESKAYVSLTLDVLKTFGICVFGLEDPGQITYKIQGKQKYWGPNEVSAEGDWSNAAFWIIAGILRKDCILTCTDLRMDSLQGDKEIINLARRFGGKVVAKGNSVMSSISPVRSLHGLHIDASEIPDLVPILAVAATGAQSPTHIHNAKRLRLKESDRLSALYDCLSRLGADVTEKEDGLFIQGGKPLKGGVVKGYNDHRIVMAMSIASILCKEPVIIEGAEAVNKSYPKFFEEFVRLGGEIHEV